MIFKKTEKNLPRSIGAIMDGNRRWARERGAPTFEGHRRGYEKIKEFVGWARETGISTVFVYAFSKENWNRSKEEVNYLMDIFRKALFDDLKKMGDDCRIRFIGDLNLLPDDLKSAIKELEAKTKDRRGLELVIALSYSGRDEIIRAIRKIKEPEKITEDDFSNLLDTAGVPNPDIILRTSGEKRLSGFLSWQGIYSELFFIEKYWPDFNKEDFLKILKEYMDRGRRFGK